MREECFILTHTVIQAAMLSEDDKAECSHHDCQEAERENVGAS